MDSNKLITIAIPTYNRPASIQRQVRSILPQLTDEVSLVVLDNHSSTSVEGLFNDYELKQFKIIRNSFNIGGDANIAKCFQVCETKWLWTLSDDDFLKDNAVEYVIDHLKKEPDCTYFNFHYTIEDTIHGFDEFVRRCNVQLYSSLFWMSICVYNMERLSDYMQYYFPAMSSMQPGVVLLVRALQKDPTNYLRIVKSNYFQEKDDLYNVTWSRSSFVYATLFLFDLLRDLKKDINSNLFSTITQECIDVTVWHYRLNKKKKESLELLNTIRKRRGIYNTIRYNGRGYIKSFVIILTGRV